MRLKVVMLIVRQYTAENAGLQEAIAIHKVTEYVKSTTSTNCSLA